MKRTIIFAGCAAAALFTAQIAALGDNTPGADSTPSTPATIHPVDQNAAGSRADESADSSRSAEGAAKSLTQRGSENEKEFDGKWLVNADIDNATEIQISRIVESKTQDPEVKQFAQKLIQDHTQAEQELRQIAQSKGYQWPSQLDEVGNAKVAAMQKMDGPDLDRCYVYGNVGDHVTDILWYKAAEKLVTDPELKQFAQKTLPTLEEHLHMARKLAGAGHEAMTAGHHMHGRTPAGETGSTNGNGSSTGSNSQPDAGSNTQPEPKATK